MSDLKKYSSEVPGLIEKSVLVPELVQRLSEQGSLNLQTATPEEKNILLGYFKENYESIGAEEAQIFIEEFLHQELISEDEVLSILEKIDQNDEIKIKLAAFIAHSLPPAKYLTLFYECFVALDIDDRYVLGEELMANPETVIMVLPFFIKYNDRTVLSETLSKTDYMEMDNVDKFLGPLVRYLENRHNADDMDNEVEDTSSLTFTEQLKRRKRNKFLKSKDNISVIISNLASENPAYIFPYLEKLIELGVYTEDDVEHIVTRIFGYTNSNSLRQKRNDLFQNMLEKAPQLHGESYFWAELYDIPVRSVALKLGKMMDGEQILVSRRIGSQFTYARKILDKDPEEYLDQLEDDAISILSFVEQWGMSKAEIANYIQSKEYFPTVSSLCTDIKYVLDYDAMVPGEPSLREMIVNRLVQDVKNQREKQFIYIKNLVLNFDEVKTWFSEEEFSLICSAISEDCPELWLYDIQELVERSPETVNDIISSGATDPRSFITHALRLRHAVLARGLGDNGGRTAWEEISTKAKQILLENPNILLSFPKKITEQFVSEQEQAEFINKALSQHDPDLDFLRALLSYRCAEYIDELKQVALRSKPFQIYLVQESTSPSLLDIVGFRQAVEIFIENINELDSAQVRNDKIFSVMSESDCESFIKSATACGRLDLLKLLYDYFGSIFFAKNTKDSIEEQIADLEKKLILDDKKSKSNDKPLSPHARQFAEYSLKRLQKCLERGHYTTDEAIKNGRDNKTLISKIVTEACDSSPRTIFTPGFIEIVEHPEELIKRDIRAEADVNPQILLTEGVAKYIDREEWDQLLCEYARGVIFTDSEEFGNWFSSMTEIPPKFYSIVNDTNPHNYLFEEGSDNAVDIHFVYIQRLKDNGWFEVYETQLREIADKNRSEARLYNSNAKIDINFRELVDKIGLLDACEGIDQVKEYLISLPEPRRSSLLDKIAFLSLRNIDLDLDLTDLDEFEKKLDRKISVEVEVIFGISEKIDVKELSIEGVIALSRYWSSLKEKGKFEKVLRNCVVAHLTGNYLNWRNWGEEYSSSEDEEVCLQRLKQQKLVPESISLEQYKAWVGDQTESVEAQLEYEIGYMKNDLEKIIRLAIQDGHIKKELLESGSLELNATREKIVEKIKILQQKLSALKVISKTRELTSEESTDYKLLQQQIVEERKAVESQLNHNLALRCLHQIKLITSEELKKRVLKIDGKEYKFSYVFSLLQDELGKDTDFAHDIERIKNLLYSGALQIFGETNISNQELELTDEVDFKTYVKIGEEPVSSCQSYKDGCMNEGLASTVVDPAVRVIQVRQKDGKIIARSLLRLLQNQNGEPVLYVERLYSTNSHPKIQEIVNSFAVEKAEGMGVKVCGTIEDSVGSKSIETVNLESKASRAPYMYSDGGGGLSRLGIFNIKTTRQL